MQVIITFYFRNYNNHILSIKNYNYYILKDNRDIVFKM